MLKKLIKYVDYDDVPREEFFNFNLSPAEYVIMQANYPGGDLPAYFKKVSEEAMENPKPLVELFLDLLKTTYGTRLAGSQRFVKSEAIWEEFRQGPAFSPFFMGLLENSEAAADFVNAVFKDNIVPESTKPPLRLVELPKDDAPAFKQPTSAAENRLSQAMGFTPTPGIGSLTQHPNYGNMTRDELAAELARLNPAPTND